MAPEVPSQGQVRAGATSSVGRAAAGSAGERHLLALDFGPATAFRGATVAVRAGYSM